MITLKQLEAISASRGDMPASEWATLLESCPEWVAQRDARDADVQLKESQYFVEEAPLRDDLHKLGYQVKWVWDFVNSTQDYADAIPTLVVHLLRPYSDAVREGIARALAVRAAKGLAGNAIIQVLHEEGLGTQLRWALANSLVTVADRSNRESIKTLLANEANSDVADRLGRAFKSAAK